MVEHFQNHSRYHVNFACVGTARAKTKGSSNPR
jgi:hypothetical protein